MRKAYLSKHGKKLRRFNRVLMKRLAGNHRTQMLNRTLGGALAFVAGLMNAGGFLVLRQYTSHMTGTLSSIADMAFLNEWDVVYKGIGVILCFILGSMFTTICIILGRDSQRHSQYALPLIIEAGLLIVFSFVGFLSHCSVVDCLYLLMFLLSFVMGMQNAVITKISKAEVRTTHVTGTVTDIGIGIGWWLLSRFKGVALNPKFSLDKLQFNTILVCLFFLGGWAGAWGFSRIGFYFCLFPVAILLWLSLLPVWLDIPSLRKRR
ncbi:MAG: YoaK family protein [Pseudomonadota bacterium]